MGGAQKTSKAFREVLKAEGKAVNNPHNPEYDDEDSESNASTAGDTVMEHAGEEVSEMDLSSIVLEDGERYDRYASTAGADDEEAGDEVEKGGIRSRVYEYEDDEGEGLDWFAASDAVDGVEEHTGAKGGIGNKVEGQMVGNWDAEIDERKEYDFCSNSSDNGGSERYDFREDAGKER